MPREHHRPVQFTDAEFAAIKGGEDPALVNRVAHDTANALLHRVREDPDPAVVERLVTYTDVHGIDAIAELWARVGPHTLPGALWRIYLVRTVIRQNPEEIAYLFERGDAAHRHDRPGGRGCRGTDGPGGDPDAVGPDPARALHGRLRGGARARCGLRAVDRGGGDLGGGRLGRLGGGARLGADDPRLPTRGTRRGPVGRSSALAPREPRLTPTG
ncbi:DNA-directed RNA polymerase subunit beta [Curtobacterium sp. MCPF17_052]|uniref:DNA-directed RNA polymerase subunit beta n=1 Tax=Curtobacterium sp. MCPF17_052 TaxID=2175655 RepID=UPI003464C4D3